MVSVWSGCDPDTPGVGLDAAVVCCMLVYMQVRVRGQHWASEFQYNAVLALDAHSEAPLVHGSRAYLSTWNLHRDGTFTDSSRRQRARRTEKDAYRGEKTPRR
jgi:hypothetical protein